MSTKRMIERTEYVQQDEPEEQRGAHGGRAKIFGWWRRLFVARPVGFGNLEWTVRRWSLTGCRWVWANLPSKIFSGCIRRARSSKKVRLEVDSVSYWMATNNAKDNVKKQDYFARFGIAEGIKRLAKDFPFRAR